MDKNDARKISNEVISALKAKFPKWMIDTKGGNFSDSTLSLKIDISVPNEKGEIEPREITDFKKYAGIYDLSVDDLYKTFTSSGELFKIGGLLLNKRTYPILGVRVSDNKRFVFKASRIKELLPK